MDFLYGASDFATSIFPKSLEQRRLESHKRQKSKFTLTVWCSFFFIFFFLLESSLKCNFIFDMCGLDFHLCSFYSIQTH